MAETIAWKAGYLQLLDQTLLPETIQFTDIYSIEDTFDAIRGLKVRGAPAIGITAGYGLYLGMKNAQPADRSAFFELLEKNIQYLSEARPTAVNLVWALRQMQSDLRASEETDVAKLLELLLNLALELHDDDRRRCEGIGKSGQELIADNSRILTHCNTGALATGGIGTALGVILYAHDTGKSVQVYANETRPVLQGARLTMWELNRAKVPAQLICDSMGGTLMQQKKVDMVILGADRIAADGSVANKIGTYNLAIMAKYHRIPFYVAAPLSTFDMNITRGEDIPIEYRNKDEIRRVFNKQLITVPDVDCWNPAFDVTPPDLVSAIITEKGLIRPPYTENIKEFFKS